MALTTEMMFTVESLMENLEARRIWEWDEDFNPSDFVLQAWADAMHDEGVVTEAQIDSWLKDLW